jgi:DNA-binding CsgD family transcriptional regulator
MQITELTLILHDVRNQLSELRVAVDELRGRERKIRPMGWKELVEQGFKDKGLSSREVEVAVCRLQHHKSAREIGAALYLSEGAVKTYFGRIKEKLDLDDIDEIYALLLARLVPVLEEIETEG